MSTPLGSPSDSVEVTEDLERLTTKLREAVQVMDESRNDDSARFAKADEERQQLAANIETLMAERATKQREDDYTAAKAQMDAFLGSMHTPSKASAIGTGKAAGSGEEINFFAALAESRNPNPTVAKAGWDKLEEIGSSWADVPGYSKATLGDTDAAGGNLVPNNLVTSFVEQAVASNPYRSLVNVVTGVVGAGVDLPFEDTAPTRALVIAAGATKTNLDFSLGNYSATLYTLAQIYDVANQLLRHSAGAAEQLVRSRLGRGLALGEAYYILNGTGSAEPLGIITALTGTAYTTARPAGATTSLANTTIAAIGAALGAVQGRNVALDGMAIVMNPSDFWAMNVQGSDNAGFWSFAPGMTGDRPTARAFGIPVVVDGNLASDTALVGNFQSTTLFIGQGYRVDVSTEANTRWDRNVTGFRAEEEIGFNAAPAVLAGNFQRVTNAV